MQTPLRRSRLWPYTLLACSALFSSSIVTHAIVTSHRTGVDFTEEEIQFIYGVRARRATLKSRGIKIEPSKDRANRRAEILVGLQQSGLPTPTHSVSK